MPERFHIHSVPIPGHFRRVGKFGSIDWREDCSRCTNCVKPRCIYDTYKKEAAYNRDPSTYLQPLYECKACLSCVQGCTKGLLGIGVNPEYLALGDAYWKADILATTWNQADNGRVPVSGAGYRGKFYGPGFDSIWTDMSEIVRPTRDGIHGREYISTNVDIGPKPMRMHFNATGDMLDEASHLIEIQIPLVLDLLPCSVPGALLTPARLKCAKAIQTLAIVEAVELASVPADLRGFAVPLIRTAEDLALCQGLLSQFPMIEIAEGPSFQELAANVKRLHGAAILAARVDFTVDVAERVLQLSASGIKVVHLIADLHGREKNAPKAKHIKDALRKVHRHLVEAGLRDEITLIVSGGIALAEHMAKTIICGADLVGMDIPMLVSLGCQVCEEVKGNDGNPRKCPADIKATDLNYVAQRMINLAGAWHSQLIEVLGAMGIREVRRLRGEVGRAMFLEELEKEAFGDLVHR